MRITSTPLLVAAVAALVAMTACDPGTTAAAPEPTPEPTSPAAASDPGPTTAGATTAAVASASAGDTVTAAATATRTVTSAFVRYSATGFDALTATSWAAQVTVSPPTAVGSADLLIDGSRSPTDFNVAGGRLSIENADGVREDVGEARGVLDPPRILDPGTGLAALLAAASDPAPDTGPAELNGQHMVRLHAQLPASAAALLLPSDSLAGKATLPVTLWLDPAAGNMLRQLILTADAGSVTVTVDPTGR